TSLTSKFSVIRLVFTSRNSGPDGARALRPDLAGKSDGGGPAFMLDMGGRVIVLLVMRSAVRSVPLSRRSTVRSPSEERSLPVKPAARTPAPGPSGGRSSRPTMEGGVLAEGIPAGRPGRSSLDAELEPLMGGSGLRSGTGAGASGPLEAR